MELIFSTAKIWKVGSHAAVRPNMNGMPLAASLLTQTIQNFSQQRPVKESFTTAALGVLLIFIPRQHTAIANSMSSSWYHKVPIRGFTSWAGMKSRYWTAGVKQNSATVHAAACIVAGSITNPVDGVPAAC